MNRNKFLVVSYSIPDRSTGTPVVVRKFLENFQKDDLILIGRPTMKVERIQGLKFEYPIVKIPTPPVSFRGEKLWRFLSIPMGIIIGMFLIKKYKLSSILAFYRDESSLLTGYLIHKITNLPFYTYFCDIYLENYSSGFYRKLAKWLQPRVFQSAKKIFVLTEGMQKYFQKNYDLEVITLPHCNNQDTQRTNRVESLVYPIKIGYLGSINVDRINSLRILCDSIMDDDRFFLTYFTSMTRDKLLNEGLLINNSTIKRFLDDELLLDELAKCDFLFLPVLLNSNAKERFQQIQTGFPTKAIEYLMCQKPIILHSKKEFFVSNFFEKYNCGLLVEGGKEELSFALHTLIDDKELREKLSNNSLFALEYFNGKNVVSNFLDVINDQNSNNR
jgi:glycosyltransferase involved in cell wall biosynthesis